MSPILIPDSPQLGIYNPNTILKLLYFFLTKNIGLPIVKH